MYKSILDTNKPVYVNKHLQISSINDVNKFVNVESNNVSSKHNLTVLTINIIDFSSDLSKYWSQWGFLDKKDAVINLVSFLRKELKEYDITEQYNDNLDSTNDEEIPSEI